MLALLEQEGLKVLEFILCILVPHPLSSVTSGKLLASSFAIFLEQPLVKKSSFLLLRLCCGNLIRFRPLCRVQSCSNSCAILIIYLNEGIVVDERAVMKGFYVFATKGCVLWQVTWISIHHSLFLLIKTHKKDPTNQQSNEEFVPTNVLHKLFKI